MQVFKRADVLVERVRGDERVVHQPQLGLEARGDLPHPRFELLRGGQQPAPLLEHLLAGRGERDARAVAGEQGQAQLVFQLAHGVRDGGRHLVQPLGGTCKRAVAGNGVDGFNGFQREFQHGPIP
ncbi:hypothetical protein D3C71_1714660 [compost metagenome]